VPLHVPAARDTCPKFASKTSSWGTGTLVMAFELERLFKLRLVVARIGEMDNAKWWNTTGVLGEHGRMLFSRGFPKTHRFAQARAVFEVARARSREVFDVTTAWTLWKLPAQVENALDARWPSWLDGAADWEPFFKKVSALQGQTDAVGTLQALGLLSEQTLVAFKGLRREHDGRSVALPKATELSDDVIALLAAGFGRGESQAPAIPYVRLGT
jgi:hypothetical protein